MCAFQMPMGLCILHKERYLFLYSFKPFSLRLANLKNAKNNNFLMTEPLANGFSSNTSSAQRKLFHGDQGIMVSMVFTNSRVLVFLANIASASKRLMVCYA